MDQVSKIIGGLVLVLLSATIAFIAGGERARDTATQAAELQINKLRKENAEMADAWKEQKLEWEERLLDVRGYGVPPPRGAAKELVLKRVSEMRSIADNWEWNAKQVKEGEPVNP